MNNIGVRMPTHERYHVKKPRCKAPAWNEISAN
jgi:hypothetical protein